MNPITFTKKWIEGIKNITPAQQLHAKLMAILGGIVGLIGASVVIILQGHWYWSMFLFFMVVQQIIEYISVRQQYVEICKIADEQKMLQQKLLNL